jgi:hypothetical protein
VDLGLALLSDAMVPAVPRGEGTRVARMPLSPPLAPPLDTLPEGLPAEDAPPGEPGTDLPYFVAAPSPAVDEASPMSSLRIPAPLIRLLPTLTAAPGARPPGDVPTEASLLEGSLLEGGLPEGLDEAPSRRPGRSDNFRAQPPPPPGRPLLVGDARPPVKPVEELVPPDLEQVEGQEELAHRFASDAALLAAHLQPARASGSERAQRLWAFYAAYAEAAAGKPPQPEAKAAFREALEGQGFAQLRDARTGESGVERGLWVLASRTPEEARERGASVRLEPPPEVRHSEAAVRKDAPPAERASEQALALPTGARTSEAVRGLAVPVALEAQRPGSQEAEDDPTKPRRERPRKLGPMTLWNVLHRFRADPEDSAVLQAQWDRATFGAVLALAAIALITVALVSL